jgi:putative salt-induced outer membrane protein YdiY
MERTVLLGIVVALSAAHIGTNTSHGQAAAPAPPPAPKWEKSAALGLTLTEGNSDTLLVTGNLLASRKGERNEILLGVDGTYGENNDVKNNETLHGFGQYNRLFTDRFYGYARLDGLHDAIADVEYRFTFSPGVGYYFIKNDQTRLSAEIGPGYIYEKQGDDERGYFMLRLAEKFEHKFNDKTKLWQSFEVLPEIEDFDNYILNAELGVETQLVQKLALRSYVQDTYDNEPAPGRKKNDIKLVTALVYKF